MVDSMENLKPTNEQHNESEKLSMDTTIGSCSELLPHSNMQGTSIAIPKVTEYVNEWLESKEIIKKFLRDVSVDLSENSLDHNASAIIARLAQANFLIRKVV